ncbi:hypothetical protein [Streptomyces tubercidicus]
MAAGQVHAHGESVEGGLHGGQGGVVVPADGGAELDDVSLLGRSVRTLISARTSWTKSA